MKKFIRILAALACALILLTAGCSKAVSGESAYPPQSSYKYGSDSAYKEVSNELPSEKVDEGNVAEGRKLIKTASFTIESLEYEKSLDAIRARCSDFSGYIQSEEEDGVRLNSSGTRDITITMRVPADRLDEFVSAVDTFGNVISKSSNAEDITENYYDTETRLQALTIQEERYLELLKKADSMEDIITIEKALTEVRYQIENLTGTLRKYDSLVSYSTVTVHLYEVYDLSQQVGPTASIWDKIGEAFEDSIEAFGDFWEFVVLAFVTVLPFLITIAVITVVIVILVRVDRRKKARKNNSVQPKA